MRSILASLTALTLASPTAVSFYAGPTDPVAAPDGLVLPDENEQENLQARRGELPPLMPVSALPMMPWRYDDAKPSFRTADSAGYYQVVRRDGGNFKGYVIQLAEKSRVRIPVDADTLAGATIYKLEADQTAYDPTTQSFRATVKRVERTDPELVNYVKYICAVTLPTDNLEITKNPDTGINTVYYSIENNPTAAPKAPRDESWLVLSNPVITPDPKNAALGLLNARAAAPETALDKSRSLWRSLLPFGFLFGHDTKQAVVGLNITEDQLPGLKKLLKTPRGLALPASFEFSDGVPVPINFLPQPLIEKLAPVKTTAVPKRPAHNAR